MPSPTNDLTLDVCPILNQGGYPLPAVLAAVDQLRPGQALRLLSPFELAPLYALLASRGLTGRGIELSPGLWETRFLPGPSAAPVAVNQRHECQTREVDARGLPPPEPLVRILEAVEGLSPGTRLVARTDRRPVHLLDALDARGLRHACVAQPDDSWATTIECVAVPATPAR